MSIWKTLEIRENGMEFRMRSTGRGLICCHFPSQLMRERIGPFESPRRRFEISADYGKFEL